MADNFTVNATTTAGDTFAADEISGVKHQRVKIEIGADGSASDVSTANPMPVSDAGGSITVDGTVAATQSGTWNVTNVSGTVSLPTGASTSANQTTIIGHVDGIEGLLTTIDADTSALAGAVSGAEMQVDIVAALPAGTNAIGKLAANSGVDIGDVDVTSVTPGTSASSLGKAEDAAHSSGDVGVMALAVRQDSDASLSSATGDYSPLQVDSNGYLKVNIKAGAGSGGTASTDDAAFTAASGSGTPLMGFVTSDSVDSGDVGVVGMLANRQLKVTLFDSGGTELSVGGGTQYTEDAAAAANPVGNALIAVRDDSRAGSLVSADGDNVALRGNNFGELYVKHTDAIQLASGTNGIGKLTANSGVDIGDVDVTSVIPGTGATNLGKAEDAAHASGDTGVMALGVRRDANTTLVSADGDYAPLQVDASGSLKVAIISGAGSGGTSSTDDAAFTAASGSGTPIMGFASSDAVDSGDVGVVGMTVNRAMKVTLFDSGGSEITAGSSVPVTVAAGATTIAKAEDAASADADVGVPAMAVRKATPANTSGTDGDYEMLQMSAGRLWVDASGVTLTVGAHAVTNAGTFATQVDGAALTALQLIDDTIFADDAAFTVGTSKVSVAGFIADEASTDSVDEGDAGAARMTLDRKIITSVYSHAAGGATPGKLISASSTNATSVKASAGTLYTLCAFNVNAAARYLKLYNKASSPTVGTDTPVLVFMIPGNTAGAGFVLPIPACGIAFDTGIAFALTTGIADSDTGAVAASELCVSYSYK